MIVLGIESSCDETAIAIVQDGTKVLASSVASSLDLHAKYGGVVPEIAARSHIEAITPLLDTTLENSQLTWDDIDAIAVTKGAGLMGSLLIGVLTARTLAIAKQKPLYGINHVEAHVYANYLMKPTPKFPLLSLIVSGGHTQLVYFKDHSNYQILGRTTDDAVGECFDKVAKILGLAYPGGPSIAKAAEQGDPNKFTLPKAKLDEPYNFSFSGLKTAVLRLAQEQAGRDFRTPSIAIPTLLNKQQKNDIAASFQQTAVETLVEKTLAAYKEFKPKTVVIAGGVAASQALRQALSEALPIEITSAPMEFCTDNGAMVAALGFFKAKQGIDPDDPYTLEINPNLKM